MANNKNFVSNKEKRQQALQEEKRQHAYKSPSKTAWGKILIVILVLAMTLGGTLAAIIFYLVKGV